MIQAENLAKAYGSDFAARDVSFHITKGEIVGLLGHNGAGKTTIMKMLTGFLEPTTGSVKIGGYELADEKRQAQDIIGYLPENCPVYPEMSVIGYLDYCASLRKLSNTRRAERISSVLAMTEITGRAFDRIDTLSRGLRQRLGVAQALLHEPDVLILDEPTNGLDPTQIQHMRELIKGLAPHATIIISTHIMQEVQAVCDRVIILRDGEKVLDENLSTLRQTRNIWLALEADDAEPVLSRLPYVKSISRYSHDGVFRYSLEVSNDIHEIAPQLADTVMENKWRMFELTPETRDLESIFSETMLSAGRDQ